MRFEKEYRFIYGVWEYVERILDELKATREEVNESGSEDDKLVKIYEAKLPDASIRAEVVYEKKYFPPLSKHLNKISFTTVKIDITSTSPEREKEILDYFTERLSLYTLRAAG